MQQRHRVRIADAGVSPRRLPALTRHVFRLAPLQPKGFRLNYYRHFPGDYLRDTLHLSAAEDGMYRRLLDLAYTTEKPLPSDRVLIYRLTRCRSRSDKRAVDRVIDQFFTKTRFGYTHKRVKEEISLLKSRADTARQNGTRGGRPKTQGKPSGLSKENPVGYPGKSSPDSRLQTPEHGPNGHPQDPSIVESSSSGGKLDDLKKSYLSKCSDPDGIIAAMVEIVCARAEKSGIRIQSEAYIAKAVETFDTSNGQDKEELQEFLRGRA